MRLTIALAGALLLATACTATPDTTADDKPVATRSTRAAPPAEPQYPDPAATDFELTVKTLAKQCFGSAGCNITFRVDLGYGGPTLDPDVTYELTYEIRGGEDPMIGTLEVTGDSYERTDEEMISTSSSRKKLRAVVTEVAAA